MPLRVRADDDTLLPRAAVASRCVSFDVWRVFRVSQDAAIVLKARMRVA